MRRFSRVSVAMALVHATLSWQTAQAQYVLPTADAEQHARASFPEYLELLAIPNDAADSSAIQKNARWLDAAFARRGFHTKLLANGERQSVLAQWGEEDPKRKTILFYMHFDGQPVDPSAWKTDPWKPALRVRGEDGTWKDLPIERLKDSADPEWRVFARSSADDKGPITMFLAAVDALKARNLAPAVNVKVLLDSEEEKNSPSLHVVMRENAELLASSGMVIYDGPMVPGNKPGIAFGTRGSIQIDLSVFGPRAAVHSGAGGNIVPNPAMRLASLLASMKDLDGRVTIPGFYDKVQVSEDDEREMAKIAPPTATLRKTYGIASVDGGGKYTNAVQAVQYPSLDIIGLQAGNTGLSAAAAIPATATATLNIRTVPETSTDYLMSIIKSHLVKQGFHVVDGAAPSEAEREQYSRLVSLSLRAFPSSATAVRAEMNSPLGSWVTAGVTAPRNVPPIRIRMGGATLPMSATMDILHVPYVVVPLVNADNNQHSVDENLRMGNYVEGIRTIASMLTTEFR